MSDLDNELSRTLNRRAENLSAVPLAFDDVRGKATSIRRRRRVVTGLAAAAAVAVIVPTAMFASQNLNADKEIGPVDTPTVVDSNDPTPSEGPTMGADAGALDVAGLPTGAPPAWSLVTDGGAAANTEEAAVRWTQQGVLVETAGQTFGPYPSSSGLARNPAGTAVAWATDEGQVMAWADGLDEPFVVAETDLAGVEVAAITGTLCTPGQSSDCVIYASGFDMATNESFVFTLTSTGDRADVDPDRVLIDIKDATDDGRVVGVTSIDELAPSSCSAVLDPAASGSTPLWKTCKHTLEQFSPNGDYLLASPTYNDGLGPGVIAIYDARTGDLLVDRRNETEGLVFYNSAVWEDETHVLFTVFQDGKWSIVRINVDGAMEYAIAPEKGDEMEVPWHFETR
jgi:hypothetical protein